jgi:CspA family cold shock protein
METGTVKFFNNAKGFGFIKADSGQEVFVHANDLTDKITEGDKVEFEVKDGQKGPSAVNVRKV